MNSERVTRGSLPHWYKPGHPHFVTYRLAGTIPAATLSEWKSRRAELLTREPPGVDLATYRDRINKQFFAQYDRFLDSATGDRWLADPQVAAIVRDNLLHHHGSKYELLAWCIMSNHVHVVLQPFETVAVPVVDAASVDPFDAPVVDAASVEPDASSVHHESLPSDELPRLTQPPQFHHAQLEKLHRQRSQQCLRRTGPFWQRESYDHWIRDLDELERIVAYVIHNPVTAGLCSEPHLWQFSSAYDRFHLDGSTCGTIGQLQDHWRRPSN